MSVVILSPSLYYSATASLDQYIMLDVRTKHVRQNRKSSDRNPVRFQHFWSTTLPFKQRLCALRSVCEVSCFAV